MQWFSSPTSFSLMLLVFLEVPSLPSIQRFLRIQQGILIQLSPIEAGTTIYHVTCRMPENSKSLGPEFRKKRHLPKIIVWPSGRGWWSPRGFISKHRLNSFGGLSLVCDWRYACRTLKPNGVLSSPLKFFPARTWRKMNFRPKILFGIIRSTDLFSGVANLESVRFKSGGGNVFPQPPRSSRFGIPAIHREVGKSLEK